MIVYDWFPKYVNVTDSFNHCCHHVPVGDEKVHVRVSTGRDAGFKMPNSRQAWLYLFLTLSRIRCRNFDGGFGCIPGAESHAGQIFTCVGALSIARSLHLVDEGQYILSSTSVTHCGLTAHHCCSHTNVQVLTHTENLLMRAGHILRTVQGVEVLDAPNDVPLLKLDRFPIAYVHVS